VKAILIIFWFTVALCPVGMFAQFPELRGNARSRGMAGAGVMLTDQWSAFNNPAGLAQLLSPVFGIYYENYYLVPELGLGAFSLSIPTRTGNFSAGFSAFGVSGLRQSRAVLSYGKSLGKKTAIGMGIHYLTLTQPEGYQDFYAVIPSLGIQYDPHKKLTLGISVFNPACQHYLPVGNLLVPARVNAGAGYQFDNNVLICLEMDKPFREQPSYYGGFEISLHKQFMVRFGITSGALARFSLGAGYTSQRLSVDLAFSHHKVLNFTTAIAIGYQLQ
jgi:hypothetical protein